ncbi:MAG: hypothetical protein IT270_08990 [Saprospiraceae bacterium]|nr:hypothetical protein [Saprospiraceae bacterium]
MKHVNRLHFNHLSKIKWAFILGLLFCSTSQILGQQFSSDSYLSKPHGMVTIIPTFGQRNSMLMSGFSLFPRWEFTIAAYTYNNDGKAATDDGYSTSYFVKYMFYENKAKTGGAAFKFGTGLFPGYLSGEDKLEDAFKTYWFNFPITIPLFNNTLQWDLMPGASLTFDYGEQEKTASGLTYATRLAWYPFHPEVSIVGEVFGNTGQAASIPEYKLGLRWEPSPHAVIAITYGQEFTDNNGAGFEFGVMLFTPPFACIGGCGKTKAERKGWFKREFKKPEKL